MSLWRLAYVVTFSERTILVLMGNEINQTLYYMEEVQNVEERNDLFVFGFVTKSAHSPNGYWCR